MPVANAIKTAMTNPSPPADRAANQSTSFSTIAPVPMYASILSANVRTARISVAFQNSNVNNRHHPFCISSMRLCALFAVASIVATFVLSSSRSVLIVRLSSLISSMLCRMYCIFAVMVARSVAEAVVS